MGWLAAVLATISVLALVTAPAVRLDRGVRTVALGPAGVPAARRPATGVRRGGAPRPSGGRRARRARLRTADAELPQFLDLLAVATSAGLAAPLALRRAAEDTVGPLGDELRTLVAAVDLGARWREELDELVERLPLPDLRRTVAVLARSERLGSPLSETLAELSSRIRETRRTAATERARTAPVKMLFPLVFLVLPAFLLLTVVPVLLSTVRSI
jgi:tight adherence protein C